MDKIFKEHEHLDVCFQTSDGVYFYTEDTAKNHAKKLDNKKVKKLEREEEKQSEKETFADIIAKAPEMDLDTVNKYLDAENALEKPRKSVLEALKKRIIELENPA